MRVLHFSYFNTVNVPFTYCQMYRRMGHDARLLTLYRHRGHLPEDICLHKRLYDPAWLRRVRNRRTAEATRQIQLGKGGPAHEYRPANAIERLLLGLRDSLRAIEFARLARTYGLYDFDLYHFHGGMDFFRDSRWVRRLAAAGKPIICNYHGPDLRDRGVVAAVNAAAGLSITNEYDLLELLPNLHYIPIPYDCSHLPSATPPAPRLRIIHTPSVPAAKGTHLIEPVLRRIASERNVEIMILTGVSHERIIEEKSRAHIAIEQIGNFGGTGYGVNSLETLAMNIPTVTEFTPAYAAFLRDHPFVLADERTLYDAVLKLVDNEQCRRDTGMRGRIWVEQNHGYAAVWRRLLELLTPRVPKLAQALADGARGGPLPPLPVGR